MQDNALKRLARIRDNSPKKRIVGNQKIIKSMLNRELTKSLMSLKLKLTKNLMNQNTKSIMKRVNVPKKRIVGNQNIIKSMLDRELTKSLMNLKMKLTKNLMNLKMKPMMKRVIGSQENGPKKRIVGNQKIIKSMLNRELTKSLMNLKMKMSKSLMNLKMKSMMKKRVMGSSSIISKQLTKSLMNLKNKLIKNLRNLQMASKKRVVISSISSMRRQREYKSYRRTVGKRNLLGLSPFITSKRIDKHQIVDSKRNFPGLPMPFITPERVVYSKRHFATKVEQNMAARDGLERSLRRVSEESLTKKKLSKN